MKDQEQERQSEVRLFLKPDFFFFFESEGLQSERMLAGNEVRLSEKPDFRGDVVTHSSGNAGAGGVGGPEAMNSTATI